MFDYLREHPEELFIWGGVTLVAIVIIIGVLDWFFGILDDPVVPQSSTIEEDN